MCDFLPAEPSIMVCVDLKRATAHDMESAETELSAAIDSRDEVSISCGVVLAGLPQGPYASATLHALCMHPMSRRQDMDRHVHPSDNHEDPHEDAADSIFGQLLPSDTLVVIRHHQPLRSLIFIAPSI